MLPDPADLRAAATGLVVVAADVRGAAAGLAATLAGTDWVAPAVDDVRREFGLARALAEAGCRDLEAGAAHLRRLADVLEQLAKDSARLRRTAAHDLVLQQRLVGPGDAADAMARRLAELPPVDDPSWARRADAHPVALPPRSPVTVPEVPGSTRGVVRADLPQVRVLSERTRVTVTAAYAGCDAATCRTAGLGLGSLDAYGLAGSTSADWLRRLSDRGSALSGAAGAWQLAGGEAAALADLLAGADSGLLRDPRLGLAVRVLAAVRAADGSVGPLLQGLSAGDAAWLAREVPGLPARPVDSDPPLLGKPGRLDEGGWFNAAYHLGHDVAEGVAEQVAAFRAEAARLHAGIATLTGAARREAASGALAARRSATAVLERGRAVTRFAGRLPHLQPLRWLMTTPLKAAGRLRHVSFLDALLLPVSIYLDIRGGTNPVAAIVKGLLGFALTLVVAALLEGAIAALLAAAPVWAPAVALLVVCAFVGWGLDRGLGWALPRAWHALGRSLSRSSARSAAGSRGVAGPRPLPGSRTGRPLGPGRAGQSVPAARAVAGRRRSNRPGGADRPVTGLSIVPA